MLIGIPSVSFSQERLLEKANEKYDEYSFSPAIDIYKKVREKGFSSPDLLKKLGNSYYFNANYDEASQVYQELIEKYDSVVTPDYVFRYAQSLKTLGQYDKADKMMTKFFASTNTNGDSFNEDYLTTIEKNSGRYKIDTFKYNSKYSDFAPTFYKEGLIFSSDRDTGNLARYRHTWNGKDLSLIHI